MQIQENISLKPYNTFGIDVKARYFSAFANIEELGTLLEENPSSSVLILGGGSNILFTKDYDGLVLKNEIREIKEVMEDSEYVYVKAGAGENWHRFVLYCINRGWGGIENLSLIPGNVGASPMQNIGAYGVELKEVFFDLEAFHLQEKKVYRFTLNDCEFGYRDSIFKKRYKDEFVILNVSLRLRKHPEFNTSYGAVEAELQKMGVKELSLRAVSQAVINIRTSKLPDPKDIGNAGSFFKNPTVPSWQFSNLKIRFPEITGYKNADGTVKLAAAWLIDKCGWKGFRNGDAGVHTRQALVLVNYGNAKGKDIYDLSEEILKSVEDRYGIVLEREVNVI